MSEQLTNRQVQILSMLRDWIESKGYPPSIREIAEGVGLHSLSSVMNALHKLEEKGFIKRDPLRPRALVIVGPDEPTVGPVTETERLTIRMRILSTLTELGESNPEALATALSHQLKPTMQRLFADRLAKAGPPGDGR